MTDAAPVAERKYFPDPHPMLWPHTPAEAEELYASMLASAEAGDTEAVAKYTAFWNERSKRIRRASDEEQDELSDPYRHGFELEHWEEADQLIGLKLRPTSVGANAPGGAGIAAKIRRLAGEFWERITGQLFFILILLGGNRSAKSEYCAKRVVQSAMRYPRSLIVCLSETLESSQKNQQALIWKYLPREIKLLNGTRDPRKIYHINHSTAHGFTTEQVVLPNGSQISFKTYNQDPGEIEGWMLGSKHYAYAVGGWPDESCTVGWWNVLVRRCRFCKALLLWSFTPINGMTPAIKQAVGDSKILATLPAELLSADRVHVPTCPPGHMPFVQRGRDEGSVVVYFFTQFNVFGTGAGTYYDAVKGLCAGKPNTYTMKIAYGFTEDTAGRVFPLFGGAHLVRREELPAHGTNYHFHDPHGRRASPSLWVRVCPGRGDPKRPDYYVYRDWPDERRFGEWAVPAERQVDSSSKRGWDGDAGPAQRELGWGVEQYKKLFLAEEAIDPAACERGGEKDPYRLRVGLGALAAAREDVRPPFWAPAESILASEAIKRRFIDSRAGPNMHQAEKGGSCLVWDYAKPTLDQRTGQMLPRMDFLLASGVKIEEGLRALNGLIYWNKELPPDPVMNSPRLFVCEDCAQVRWALENYTGEGGEDGACKDFIDLLRYMAMENLMHLPEGAVRTTGGGAY